MDLDHAVPAGSRAGMIVFLAGMQRSGSTFAFNVARDVLRRRGGVHQDSGYDIPGQLAAAGSADHLLLKSHEMNAHGIALARIGAMRVICTVRRAEDSVASFMRVFGFTEDISVGLVRAWIDLHAQIRPFSLTIDYDLIDRHPITAARRIGRYLVPALGWAEATRIARRHAKHRVKAAADRLSRSDAHTNDLGYSFYDRNTFFHRNHVTSLKSQPAEALLPPDQLARIRAALAAGAAPEG